MLAMINAFPDQAGTIIFSALVADLADGDLSVKGRQVHARIGV
jgi:hypothetical protein